MIFNVNWIVFGKKEHFHMTYSSAVDANRQLKPSSSETYHYDKTRKTDP